MPDQEKMRKKAEICVAKAEKLMDNQRPKSAAEEFQKAAEIYFDLEEWKIAEQCFFYASKNWYQIEKYQNASNLERIAANCCVLLSDFKKARDYYDVAYKAILKSDAKNRDEIAILYAAFAFLCHFVQGQQDEALAYMKKFRSEVDTELFNSHLLIQLVKNLTNAIVNGKDEYLQAILADYPKYKFRTAEASLIKIAIVLAYISVHMKYSLNMIYEAFVNENIISIETKVQCAELKALISNPTLSYTFKSLQITDIGISIGDNASVKEKPTLPQSVNLESFTDLTLPIKFRTNFPGRGFIGPCLITVEVDRQFHVFLKSEVKNFNIVSPQAVLNIELIPQKPPVYNQTFELQAKLTNKSDGEAVGIEIEFEFPEQIKMMRGTLKKTIYALRPNESLKWELQVKGLEVGEFPIKAKILFKDPNGNVKGPDETILPLEING